MTARDALDVALRLSAEPALWSNVGSHVTLGQDGAEVACVLAFDRRAGEWAVFGTARPASAPVGAHVPAPVKLCEVCGGRVDAAGRCPSSVGVRS